MEYAYWQWGYIRADLGFRLEQIEQQRYGILSVGAQLAG
jgi:hypothetical protein